MLTILVVISLAAYRITRLIVEDGIIDTQRDWVLKRVLQRWTKDFEDDVVPDPQALAAHEIAKWRLKVWELLTCPYCMSVWVTTAVTLVLALVWSVPDPFVAWLGALGGTMVVWRIVEGE